MSQGITDSQLHSLKDQLLELRKRMLAPLFGEAFNVEDYYALFVPQDHAAQYRWLRKQVATPWAYKEFAFAWPIGRGYTIGASFKTEAEDTPFIPKEVKVQDTAPRELLGRVTQWVTQRARVMEDFARVMRVLELLAERCSTPGQVRFFFPQVMPLASSAQLDAFIKSASRGTPKDIPPIEADLRVAIRKAATTCAGAQLLEPVTGEMHQKGQLTFTVSPFSVREGTVAFDAK